MQKKQMTKLFESLPLSLKNKKGIIAEEGTRAYFDQYARLSTPEPDEKSNESSEPEVETKATKGKLLELYKSPEDQFFRLEQNLGCELPVCVSNRRDVKNNFIEVAAGNNTTWRLIRSSITLLPAPEHYPYWLWFLDRCQAAAQAGEKLPPRIIVDPMELFDVSGVSKGGTSYYAADEAFRRLSHLIINVGQDFFTPKGVKAKSFGGSMGTLCSYASWRPESEGEREALVESNGKGWVAPSQLLWDCIRSGYLKAVSLQPLRRVDSYVAQRLLVYLSKHCRPGGEFKIAAAKLLPRIPARYPPDQIKKKLRPHHQELCEAKFLMSAPVFSGRGSGLMITYERTRQGF